MKAFSGSYFPKPCAASARTKKSHRHAAVGATDPFQTVENNGQYLMSVHGDRVFWARDDQEVGDEKDEKKGKNERSNKGLDH